MTDATPMSAADLPILRPRRRGVLAAAGLAAVAIAAVVAIGLDDFIGGERHRGTDTEAAEPTDVAAAPDTPPTPEPAKVALEVTSSVPGARVLLDGDALGEAPVRTLVLRDPGEHVIRVEADGRQPVERRVALDQPVQLALDPTPTPAPPAGTKQRPHRRWRRNLTFDKNVYR